MSSVMGDVLIALLMLNSDADVAVAVSSLPAPGRAALTKNWPEARASKAEREPGGRFEVELTSPHAVEEMDKNKRAVRDEVLRYLSGLTYAATLGEEGKVRLRDEVTFRIDKTLGGGRVKRLFFTDFVVQ